MEYRLIPFGPHVNEVDSLGAAIERLNEHLLTMYGIEPVWKDTVAHLPVTGASSTVYAIRTTGELYTWGGSSYSPHTLPTLTRWDSGGNAILDTQGNPILQFDVGGNILANVNHRTGLLGDSQSGLLSLPGGDGEIAKATDADALVVYNGVAGGAKAYFRNRTREVFGDFQSSALPSVGSGTGVSSGANLLLYLCPVNDGGMFNETNGEIVTPLNSMLEVSGIVTFGASAAGTVRQVVLQSDYTGVSSGAGSWAAVDSQSVVASANAVVRFSMRAAFSPNGPSKVVNRWRLRIQQDSGLAMVDEVIPGATYIRSLVP